MLVEEGSDEGKQNTKKLPLIPFYSPPSKPLDEGHLSTTLRTGFLPWELTTLSVYLDTPPSTTGKV